MLYINKNKNNIEVNCCWTAVFFAETNLHHHLSALVCLTFMMEGVREGNDTAQQVLYSGGMSINHGLLITSLSHQGPPIIYNNNTNVQSDAKC